MIAAVGVTEDGSVLVMTSSTRLSAAAAAAGATMRVAVAVFVDRCVLVTTSSLTLRAATRFLRQLVPHDCSNGCDCGRECVGDGWCDHTCGQSCDYGWECAGDDFESEASSCDSVAAAAALT